MVVAAGDTKLQRRVARLISPFFRALPNFVRQNELIRALELSAELAREKAKKLRERNARLFSAPATVRDPVSINKDKLFKLISNSKMDDKALTEEEIAEFVTLLATIPETETTFFIKLCALIADNQRVSDLINKLPKHIQEGVAEARRGF